MKGDMDMDALTCIKTRRSSRKFLPDAVPQDILEQVIEAGRCAPTGGNTQQYHLIVIENRPVLDKLAELVQAAYAPMEITEGMYSSLVNSITQSKKGHYVFHYAPPVFIIVANKKGYANAMADSACVLENMMLAANALNLGSCWINQLHWLDGYSGITGQHPEVEAYLRSLGLNEDETVCGCLSLGYVEKLNRGEIAKKSSVTYVK